MHTDGAIVCTQYIIELESFFFSSYKEMWPYRKGCLRPGEFRPSLCSDVRDAGHC